MLLFLHPDTPEAEGGKASLLRIALSPETPLEMEFTIPPKNTSDNDVHYLCEGWVRNEVGMLQISILAVWLQACRQFNTMQSVAHII